MVTRIKVTRLLVSMFNEAQRHIADTKKRPEMNMKGFKA
jgi:hypothetical protein